MAESQPRDPDALRRAIARARSDRHALGAGWVSLGSGVFAFGLGLCVWSALEFSFQNPFEITSRITLAQYPKQQDLFAFAIAVFSVAAGALAGWFGWCALAAVRRPSSPQLADGPARDGELDAQLARWVWPFATLLVSAVPIASARWGVGALVAFPLAAAGLAACLSHWARSARVSESAPIEDPAGGGACSRTSWPALPAKLGLQRTLLGLVIPLVLYAWLYDGFLVHHRIDLHHEGEILAPWSALQDGAVPFRDIYIQHGLFQNVGKGWLAGELFGVSLASLRTLEHLLGPLGHVALYFLALAFFRSWLSAVVLVLVASVANLWAVDRQALGLLAVAALAHGLRAGQLARIPAAGSWRAGLWAARLAMLSGAATALAFFYSAEIGIFSAAACGGFLSLRLLCDGELLGRQRWLPLALYLAGAAIASLPFLLAFASAGALGDLIRNTGQQIAYQSTVWGRPYPPLVETLTSVTSLATAGDALFGKWFQWYLPPLVYLAAVGHLTLRALRGRLWLRPESGALLLLLLAALCYFASSLSRADSFHLKFGTLLTWIFVGLALESLIVKGWTALRAAPSHAARLRAVAWPIIACMGVSSYVAVVHDPVGKAVRRAEGIAAGRYWPRPVRAPWKRLGSIRIGDTEFAHLREVVAYLQRHTSAGEAIFDFSNQPAYYFLANRPNPTRYALAAYAATPEMQEEAISDLERSATALVIYRSGDYLDRLDRVPSAKRNALIHGYLRANYSVATQIGKTVILRRNDGSEREPIDRLGELGELRDLGEKSQAVNARGTATTQ